MTDYTSAPTPLAGVAESCAVQRAHPGIATARESEPVLYEAVRVASLPAVGVAMLGVACMNDFDALGVGAWGSGGARGGAAVATGSSTASSAGGVDAGTATSSTSATGAGGDGGGDRAPRHCRDIAERDPSATDGDYLVDPDGAGPGRPLTVRCDMTIDGGGWTRFNWLHGAFVTGADPLAVTLDACGVDDDACPGRIPASVSPTHLLVKDLDAGEHAAWAFDGSTLANAIIGALRDKTPICAEGPAFDPYIDTSTEAFCNSGGGCDSFKYTDSGCNGSTAWILELDDDSHFCAAAFKLGAATGVGNCGPVDWGFLDDCDCLDEAGELYFR